MFRLHHGFVTLALGAVIACGPPSGPSDSNDPGGSGDPDPNEPGDVGVPPVLSVPILDLSRVQRFIPFGAVLSSGVINPAYELVVSDPNLEVRAATEGTVRRVEWQDEDYEVHVEVPGTNYLIIYDHVKNAAVSEGDRVSPGTRLGTAGAWSPTQGRADWTFRCCRARRCTD